MKYEIQRVLLSAGYHWSNTASKERVQHHVISISVNTDGAFDLVAQRQISNRYSQHMNKKKEIEDMLKRIIEMQVKIEI